MNMENLLEAYKKMFFIRTAEETIARYYFDNKIFSFVHFYVGQEAVAVGVSMSLEFKDKVIGNHRSHGHYLAKGGGLFEMYSEMLGKASGCCKGKGGSMHMLAKHANFLGTTPILSSGVPIATGIALTEKFKKSGSISVVYVGDGASEEGSMYESLNFAATFELPILFVIEDNLYSVNTPKGARRSKTFKLDELVEAFGVRYFYADGNDFCDTYSIARNAINFVRSETKPALIHCKVYRHMAHSAPIFDDKLGYRVEDTIETRKKSDPISNLRGRLLEIYQENKLSNLESEIRHDTEVALQAAIQAPYPGRNDLYEDVYAI